jgi:transcriptional antiterminator NusG
MNMQRNDWNGAPIGLMRDGTCERALRLERLAEAANRLPGRQWFAARVWTGRETAVENMLAEMGIETCLPMRMGPELRRRGRIIPPSPVPAIHGYVLVRMPSDGSVLAGLRAFDYFIEIVGGFERPISVSDEEVRRFKALADAGLYDWKCQMTQRWRAGDKASIAAGIFFGATCEIIACRNDGDGDAVVLVSLLGKEVPMTVPLAILEEL